MVCGVDTYGPTVHTPPENDLPPDYYSDDKLPPFDQVVNYPQARKDLLSRKITDLSDLQLYKFDSKIFKFFAVAAAVSLFALAITPFIFILSPAIVFLTISVLMGLSVTSGCVSFVLLLKSEDLEILRKLKEAQERIPNLSSQQVEDCHRFIDRQINFRNLDWARVKQLTEMIIN